MKIITTTWHEYPAEKPKEGSYNLTAICLDDEGPFHACYYRAEDAAHTHSIWNRIRYWAYEKDLAADVRAQMEGK